MKTLWKEYRVWLLLLAAVLGVLLLWTGSRQPKSEPPANDEPSLAELLESVGGVGEAAVFTRYEGERLAGIAVLCEGGKDPAVRQAVIELLSSLYGLGSHRIYVGSLPSAPSGAV